MKLILSLIFSLVLFTACTKTVKLPSLKPAPVSNPSTPALSSGTITIIDSVSATGEFDTAVVLHSVQVPYQIDSVVYDTLYTTDPTTHLFTVIGTYVHAYIDLDATGISWGTPYYSNDGFHYYQGGALIWTNSNIGIGVWESFPVPGRKNEFSIEWQTDNDILDPGSIALIAN